MSALSGSLLDLSLSNINSIGQPFLIPPYSPIPRPTTTHPHIQYTVSHALEYVFVFVHRKWFGRLYSKILEIICVVDLLTIFSWYTLSTCLICFVSINYFCNQLNAYFILKYVTKHQHIPNTSKILSTFVN